MSKEKLMQTKFVGDDGIPLSVNSAVKQIKSDLGFNTIHQAYIYLIKVGVETEKLRNQKGGRNNEK